jgi:hypothetical protein
MKRARLACGVWMLPLLLPLLHSVSLRAEGIDLVTLPERSGAQLTIYNSADLTLVRDTRSLTLKKGRNRLSFDWANTLIDPTSLSLRAVKNPEAVLLLDVSYPPHLNTKAIWTVESTIEGEVPVEITYFTSGISWRAFYQGTLSQDEKTMRLDGYVRVDNHSGEEYEDAVTRLIVGKVNLLEEIAALARQEAPYGKPVGAQPPSPVAALAAPTARREMMQRAANKLGRGAMADEAKEKQIVKEGLSEYFLYTIEGTETIPDGWGKRLPSFAADGIPVVNLYRYEEERFGKSAVRFLLFANDKEHKLGDTPIPDGAVRVYRTVDASSHLSYEGASATKYIPVGQKAELELGAASDVVVEAQLMGARTENFTFDNDGNVNGFDAVESYEVKVKNRRPVGVRVEVTRNFRHPNHELANEGDFGDFKKDDIDTAKYTLDVAPRTEKTFRYTVRYHEGERR